jgi:hypothetical protein
MKLTVGGGLASMGRVHVGPVGDRRPPLVNSWCNLVVSRNIVLIPIFVQGFQGSSLSIAQRIESGQVSGSSQYVILSIYVYKT